MDNKRSAMRKRLVAPLKVLQIVNPSGEAAPHASFVFWARDVSAIGMGFDTDMQLQTGAVITLELTFPGETRVVRIQGRVLNAKKITAASPKAPYRVGLKFMNISESDRAYIQKYVAKTALLI